LICQETSKHSGGRLGILKKFQPSFASPDVILCKPIERDMVAIMTAVQLDCKKIANFSPGFFEALLQVLKRHWSLASALFLLVPVGARAQTPSPLQEWQYSGGVALEKLFEPNLPDWRVVLGAGVEDKPLYDGATLTRTLGGPVINIRYKDLAFASVGEGLGVNLVHGEHYRGGLAITYDLGRLEENDISHLHGLGDIKRAPAVKAFMSYAISKIFPMVLRADVREILGGADGMVADFDAFMPLPGSSRRLVMFAGPSYTYADHHYMQKEFGVTTTQAIASGYPVYDAHSGSDAVGFGFSATGFVTQHWLINLDTAVNRLLGSAAYSPITQKTTQHVVALSVAYSW
jgi:outer membrane scaffolding protein for murein synthesis (MipA/OmpV family)